MNVQMYEDRMMPLLLNISGVYMDFVLLRNLEEVGGGGEKIISHLLNLKLGARPNAATKIRTLVWCFTASDI
jgi:hypothetical protein